jgi:hypothetical protein
MTDEQIIANKFHELEILKDKSCVACKQNFYYKVHGNKQKLKVREFSYYTIYLLHNNNTHCVHEHCLSEFFDQYSNEDKRLTINGEEVNMINLYNRYGKQLTNVNYIKNMGTFLKNKIIEKFSLHVKHMYNTIQYDDYTFYKFDDTKLNDFIVSKNNFRYKGFHVDNNVQPKQIESLLRTID